MEYQEKISELRWLGRRLDNLYLYIQQNDPDEIKNFELDRLEKVYKISF